MSFPDQISRKQREAETRAFARVREDAESLASISDYATASMVALERFAGQGDATAKQEISRRRGR